MGTDRLPRGARHLIRLGHVLVGGVALVVAGVLIVAGRAPDAELGSVLVGLGLLLALAAAGFTCTAVVALRRAQDGHGGLLSLILSIVELAVGAALAAATAVAVQGYGDLEPWRSPLLLPSALLLALGLAGLGVEAVANRPETH
jgi:Kef-type K+ transport system membrane component KefB